MCSPGAASPTPIRSNTIAAVIAEVEVNRDTGRVWAKRLVCAHDCGLVINPMGLKHTVECGMLHGLSRALWEEVSSIPKKSPAWTGLRYPSLRHADTPEHIEVVLVNGDPEPGSPRPRALRRRRSAATSR